MPTIGMASVGSLHESDSTPLNGEGVQNALLHHTSIENRCTDHRGKSDGFRAAFYSSWYTSHDSRAAVASRSPSSANSSRSATSRSTASASRADQASRDA